MSLRHSLRTKLLVPLALLALACFTVGAVGYAGMRELDRHTRQATENLVPSLVALNSLRADLGNIRTFTWRTVLYLYEGTPERVQQVAGGREKIYRGFADGMRRFEALAHTPEERARYGAFKAHFAEFRTINDRIWQATQARDLATIRALSADQSRTLDAARVEVEALVERQQQRAEELKHSGEVARRNTLLWLVLAGGGALVIALALALRMVWATVRPLRAMADVAQAIARGDLEQDVRHQGQDELGALAEAFRQCVAYIREVANAADALSRGDLGSPVHPRGEHDVLSRNFQRATENLRGVLGELGRLAVAAREGALHERGDASRFQGVYAELVDGLNLTLASVNGPVTEASAVLERLAARDLTARMEGEARGAFLQMKRALNTAAQDLHQGLLQVSRTAGEVREASAEIALVSETVAGMAQEAREASEKGQAAMGRMVDAMARIRTTSEGTADIIEDINEIAAETNLLSVNASLQAAAAGAAAKGFAVVATEVRRLALRSREAAKKTEELIHESVDQAEQGGALSGEVHKSLAEIARSVAEVAQMMSELASAQGLANGNGTADESTAMRLSRHAELMQRLVAQFHLGPR